MVIKYIYSGSYEDRKLNGEAYVTSGSYTSELVEDSAIIYEYLSATPIHYPIREENITRIEDHLKGVIEERHQTDSAYYYQYQNDVEAVFEYTFLSSSLEES